MKTVYNIPRVIARNWAEADPNEYAWISIHEPGFDHISSVSLDSCPNIKLKFWDVTEPVPIIGEEYEHAHPATEKDIHEIFTFLIEHKNKNIIINCKAGISRSGAIAQFCADYLGHEWNAYDKQRAVPNDYIYNGLVNEWKLYNNHNAQYDMSPIVVIDKRRKFT